MGLGGVLRGEGDGADVDQSCRGAAWSGRRWFLSIVDVCLAARRHGEGTRYFSHVQPDMKVGQR